MKTIFHIYKTDWLNIFKVPIALFLILGLMVLPSLYAWFNLKAGWDPYGNTSKIPIAVTNLDEGATIHNEEIKEDINVGAELVKTLKTNNSLGWTFVSEKKAKQGVRRGDYYASILIPKDFSRRIASILNESPTHAEINYMVNEKVNAIAPKITTTGATTITQNVNESIIKMTSRALFSEFNKIGMDLENELPTMRRIKNQIFALQEALPQIKAAGEQVITIENKLPALNQKAQKIIELEKHLPEIEEAGQALIKLESKLPDIQRVGEDLTKLQSKLPDIQTGINRVTEMINGFDKLNATLSESLTNINDINHLIQNAQSAFPKLQDLTENGQTVSNGLVSFLQSNQNALQTIGPVIEQNLFLLQQTNDASRQTVQALSENPTSIDSEQLTHIKEQLTRSSQATDHLAQLVSALNQVNPSQKLKTTVGLLEGISQNYQQQSAILDNTQPNIPEWSALTDQADKSLTPLVTNYSTQTEPAVNQAISSLTTQSNSANQTITDAQQQLPQLQSLLKNANQSVIYGQQELSRLQEELPNIQHKVDALSNELQDKMPEVISGVNQAANFMNNDFPKIVPKIHQAADFIRSDLPTAIEDVHKLSDFVQQRLPELEDEVHKVADLVRNDLPDLENSLNKATNKISDFEQNHDINEIIKLLHHNIQKESDFLAHPVELKEDKVFPIPNYGSGMSPFYTTLCLWVGALLLVSLLRMDVVDMEETFHSYHIYLGRLLTFITIGIFQALIVTLGDMFLLGAYVHDPGWFIVFAIINSIVFMTIVYTFVSIFGNIGKAISIILLVLQLSSGGGTFPIQVSPAFFQAIHPFLPFTYAISLLRESVGGMVKDIVMKDIIVLLIFQIITLLFGMLLKGPLQKYTQKVAAKAKQSKIIH